MFNASTVFSDFVTGVNNVISGLAEHKADSVVGGDAPHGFVYQAGTWTPVLSATTTPGTHTYSVQSGQYVRVGNLVYLTGNIALTNRDGAASGTARIEGLPFTQKSAGTLGVFPVAIGNIDLQDRTVSFLQSEGGTTRLTFVRSGANTSLASLPITQFSNTSIVRFTFMYEI